MNKLFNFDSPLIQLLNKTIDLMLLNLLWIVCCIPIITIGASTTALYSVTIKLVKNEGSYITKDFFCSFKMNFKQSTILWLVMMVVGILIVFDIRFFYGLETILGFYVAKFFQAILVLYGIILIYLFPLLARFDDTNRRTFINAFIMAIKHLPSSIMVVAIFILAIFVFFYFRGCVFFLFSTYAYCTSYLLRRIFDKYSHVPVEF